MYKDIEEQQAREKLFEDLIEQAFLKALINGDQQSLAYCWLRANYQGGEH